MEDNLRSATPDEDILDTSELIELYKASSGRRFVNYLVDFGIAYGLYNLVIKHMLIIFLSNVYRYFDSTAVLYVMSYLCVLSWYVLFRAIIEASTGGKTIGKFLTGTRAVNRDGTRISAKTALLRSLTRAIPFEVFSALGSSEPNPWHDRWTHTFVVDESQSRLAID